MADSRFFQNKGAITLQEIAALTGAAITAHSSVQSNGNRRFTDVAPLDRASENDVSFLDNVKYADAFATSLAGACFVRPRFVARAPQKMVLLVTDNPYYCYAQVAQRFYPDMPVTGGTSPQAHIAQSAMLGKGTRVDAGVVIGENSRIGARCWIGVNTIIDNGVEIGDDSRIGACCTISHAILGQRVILHRGIHIGQDGFGYAIGGKGMIKVPQLGRVIIENDVEIGSGTCIDRGAGPDTIIGAGTKIDNLVQIGHNVQIGKHCIIVAQCGISGSTQIGDGVMLGGQVGIAGHLKIGAGAKLAAQAGVITDIPAGGTYGGYPAVPIRDWHRQSLMSAKAVRKKED